ncbi:uncharacterized protein JCM6883_004181 [Sporobolomyces salmoneus]|uniref:uncharacterized protein n=1 Tax=Sporobolomyces salmoneus TaxID=183962 RepID=UPI003175F481
MAPYLPYDVLRSILDHVADERDLARFCLTSRALLSAARPRLYDTARIHFSESHVNQSRTLELAPKTSLLLSTLRQNPQLCSLVRNVDSGAAWGDMEYPEDRQTPLGLFEPTVLVEELFQLLIAAKNFDLAYTPSGTEASMDKTVASFQERNAGRMQPSFTFRSLLPVEPGFAVLRGSYESFTQRIPSRDFDSTLSWISTLEQSRRSLRHLSIALADDLNLANFANLERLCLQLPSRLSHLPRVPALLSRVLPPLSSLRVLTIDDYYDNRISLDLLATDTLAAALPPKLASLAIYYRCETSYAPFLPFLHALPATSSLKRMDAVKRLHMKFDGRPRDWEEIRDSNKEATVVEEFGKRGIRLVLEQKWFIW